MKLDKSDNPVGDVKEEKMEVEVEQAATEEKEKKVENEKPVIVLSGLDNTERKHQLPPLSSHHQARPRSPLAAGESGGQQISIGEILRSQGWKQAPEDNWPDEGVQQRWLRQLYIVITHLVIDVLMAKLEFVLNVVKQCEMDVDI